MGHNKLAGLVKAAVKINRTNHGFQCIRQDGVSVAAASHIFTFAKHQIFSKANLSCTIGQCRLADKTGSLLAHLPLCHIREILKQKITGYNLKYCITQKLQTLIMMDLMQFVFISIRAMGYRCKQQVFIFKLIIYFLLQLF